MSPGTLPEAHLVERHDVLRESAAVGSDRNGDQYSLLAQPTPQLETIARQISLRELKCSALR